MRGYYKLTFKTENPLWQGSSSIVYFIQFIYLGSYVALVMVISEHFGPDSVPCVVNPINGFRCLSEIIFYSI